MEDFRIPTKINILTHQDPDKIQQSIYGKKLRKILESIPKPTVALKIVLDPAGMALDIKIFHGFQLELNTGRLYFPAGFDCLFNWNC